MLQYDCVCVIKENGVKWQQMILMISHMVINRSINYLNLLNEHIQFNWYITIIGIDTLSYTIY